MWQRCTSLSKLSFFWETRRGSAMRYVAIVPTKKFPYVAEPDIKFLAHYHWKTPQIVVCIVLYPNNTSPLVGGRVIFQLN